MISSDKQLTLIDVAKAAGVSHQTVSRVVNNYPHVSSKTRENVLATIHKLGYQPNRVARGLVTRSSRTVGVVSFGVDYFGPAQMLINIEKAVRESGYGLALDNLSTLNILALHQSIARLKGAMVDGIVIAAPIINLAVKQVLGLRKDVPIVLTDVHVGARIASVILDQKEGARLATQHLLDLGHTCIAEISGPLNWNDAALRHEGWLETIHRAGLESGPHVAGDWSAQSGYTAALKLLALGTPFTGLIVGNDQMALGALRALNERNLSVPKDVSLVGFDNIPEAAFFGPPLTTVRQDFGVMGKQSVEYLFKLIEVPDTLISQQVLYPELIVRSSTVAL
jgi:LacI family transcriptional regulator